MNQLFSLLMLLRLFTFLAGTTGLESGPPSWAAKAMTRVETENLFPSEAMNTSHLPIPPKGGGENHPYWSAEEVNRVHKENLMPLQPNLPPAIHPEGTPPEMQRNAPLSPHLIDQGFTTQTDLPPGDFGGYLPASRYTLAVVAVKILEKIDLIQQEKVRAEGSNLLGLTQKIQALESQIEKMGKELNQSNSNQKKMSILFLIFSVSLLIGLFFLHSQFGFPVKNLGSEKGLG